jgi:hypothetical protein
MRRETRAKSPEIRHARPENGVQSAEKWKTASLCNGLSVLPLLVHQSLKSGGGVYARKIVPGLVFMILAMWAGYWVMAPEIGQL